jgi:hypothetical protein
MRIPGFAAEASLYRARRAYTLAPNGFAPTDARAVPQDIGVINHTYCKTSGECVSTLCMDMEGGLYCFPPHSEI